MVLGMNGAYIGQVVRIILSIVWFGSQAWLGGLCVSAMLSSWSYSFLTMENTLPESAKMVTRELIGFLIFQLLSIPMLVSCQAVEHVSTHVMPISSLPRLTTVVANPC